MHLPIKRDFVVKKRKQNLGSSWLETFIPTSLKAIQEGMQYYGLLEEIPEGSEQLSRANHGESQPALDYPPTP